MLEKPGRVFGVAMVLNALVFIGAVAVVAVAVKWVLP
tara:strand:- start:985 stop:1095 length:111 start_codon:yes stop_codon:yes gene_type:complete